MFVIPTNDEDLAVALIGLYREIDRLYNAVSRRLGLTAQQARLLCLAEHAEPSFGELANLIQCDKTNVTGLVDRLERRGLIRRQADPADRRVARVIITDAGAALAAQFRQEIRTALAGQLDGWPAGRRGQLAELALASTTALQESSRGLADQGSA